MSETTIFDVLPNFFYHNNPVVQMAALEVKLYLIYFEWLLSYGPFNHTSYREPLSKEKREKLKLINL